MDYALLCHAIRNTELDLDTDKLLDLSNRSTELNESKSPPLWSLYHEYS